MDPGLMSYNLVAGRDQIDCRASVTAKAAVVVTGGQSLMGNSGDPKGSYVPAGRVFNFNWLDKKCYLAKDPLLGTTIAGANQATRLADLLVRNGIYDTVMLVPLAHGGTFAKDWAPGGYLHARLIDGLRAARAAGLEPTMILWEQGEAEAGNPPQPPDGAAWVSAFRATVVAIRETGVAAPIFVAKSTVCRNVGSDIIRSAQAAVVNGEDVLAGPDTDAISDRWDGCHFGVLGLQSAAESWLTAIAQHSH